MASAAFVAIKKKRRRNINAKYKSFVKEQDAAFDQWFEKFDVNQDQTLQRTELAELLKLFQPNVPAPDSQMMDYLMGVSATIDGDQLTVKRESLGKVMMVYRDYAREKDAIDAIFDKFDTNSSGFLERRQLLNLLQSYHETNPELYPEPEENDAKFILNTILQQNDKSHSPEGSIAKDEVLPAIATWKALAAEIMKRNDRTVSRACAVM